MSLLVAAQPPLQVGAAAHTHPQVCQGSNLGTIIIVIFAYGTLLFTILHCTFM
jgi:hypothetical protein